MAEEQRFSTTIDGVEYDISQFMKEHPGGDNLLILAAGRDSSILFHSYHRRLEVAEQALNKLPILSSNKERKPCPVETKLWKTLKQRVNQYFEKTRQSSRGNQFMLLKSMILVFLTYFSFYLAVVKGFYLLCPIVGFFMAINGLAIQHDANHGSFSKNYYINWIAGFIDDVVCGGSSLLWRHQHVVSHHLYPNDVEKDTDTYSNFPLLRLNPSLGAKWYNKYQHYYYPLLYGFLGIAYYVDDVRNFLKRKYLHVPMQPLRTIDYVAFFGGKILFTLIMLGIPIYIHGLWDGIFKFFLPIEMFGGEFLASTFVVSHNTEEIHYNYAGEDWAEMQIRTSANWSPQSTFWWLASGGLNFQIEHHLFPGICHVHYPAISEIVRKTCEEFKVPYNSHPTFYHIYQSHREGLRLLGTEKAQ
jgi:fatty acid desaturase (delta-4 desaturase)